MKVEWTQIFYKVAYSFENYEGCYCVNFERIGENDLWVLKIEGNSRTPTICQMTKIIRHLISEHEEIAKRDIKTILVKSGAKKVAISDFSEEAILKAFSEEIQLS